MGLVTGEATLRKRPGSWSGAGHRGIWGSVFQAGQVAGAKTLSRERVWLGSRKLGWGRASGALRTNETVV